MNHPRFTFRLPAFCRAAVFAVAAATSLGVTTAVHAQSRAGDGDGTGPEGPEAMAGGPWAAGVPVDTMGMGSGPWSRLSMLYEVTIFNVDVLDLEIRVDPRTTARLEDLVTGSGGETAAFPAEAVADAVVRSPGAVIRTRFCRDVSVDRFLSGARENLGHAREAGHVTQDQAERIAGEIGTQFAVLRERGFRDGDIMWYEIRGDSLVLAVEGREGRVLLRDVAEGVDRRSALLGGYMSPASDFRDKLLGSLESRTRD